MKHIVNVCLHGWRKSINYGWTKPIGLAVVFGALSFALCTVNTASAAQPSVTQLEYLQWLVQAVGDSSQFTASSTADDYIAWANLKGMKPADGWSADAELSKQAMAQTLCQLFGINVRKQGAGYVAPLAREGITLPGQINRTTLVSLLDDPVFRNRINGQSMSPTKGNNGIGNPTPFPPPGNPPPNPNQGTVPPGHDKDGTQTPPGRKVGQQ